MVHAPRNGGKGFFRGLAKVRNRILNDETENPLIGQLCKQVLALALGFLLIVPFISSYQLTQGAYIGTLDEGDGEWNGSLEGELGDAPTINNIISEDGFLLKPAINTTKGDRSGFSDIFIYTVEQGDTMSTIAERFNLKKETIMAENELWNANKVKVGTQIKILPVDGLSHIVKKGETLEKIAKKYSIDKDLIVKQNQLADATLEPDMVLIVPGAKREEPVYTAYSSSSSPSYVPNSSAAKAVGRLIWPVGPGCTLTQPYHRGHTALDIANRNHAPIYAAAAGKVVKAKYGWNGGYGNVIIIDHGNGMQTLYGHNEKLYVTEGQYVDQGQTISWMGNSGNVRGPTGIHLHFEVRINGVKYNPQNYF
ncbi:M23 family metallopeptidase [Candidatus Peregrinibacteria bacterium]|nr:M23 family metallopeptidase [Candidatus Peregrinibacteria bacterium]